MPRASMTSSHAGERDLLITVERLNVQSSAPTTDSRYPVEQFRQPLQFWAKREFVSMDEDDKLNQLSAHTVQRWSIPYAPAMDPDLVDVARDRRIAYQGRTYDITDAEIRPRNDGREIVLTTLAKVG